jgi:hypothetical protein
MSSQAAPEGFLPHFKTSPVTAPWEPLFSRRGERAVEIGADEFGPTVSRRPQVYSWVRRCTARPGIVGVIRQHRSGASRTEATFRPQRTLATDR